MKLSIHRRLRRRDLMKALGSAALALPLLELFEDEVLAQATPKKAKFAVFLYTPDGVNNKAFWPTGQDPSASPTLSVFAPYKDKMIVFGPRFASRMRTRSPVSATSGSVSGNDLPLNVSTLKSFIASGSGRAAPIAIFISCAMST